MGNGCLHKGHRERLRNRFLLSGDKGMYEHELLEIMLFYVIRRQNTNELAHILINHFGSLDAVLKAPEEELVKIKGVGPATAKHIRKMNEITAYFMNYKKPRLSLANTDDLLRYAEELIADNSPDKCFIINLDLTISVKNVLSFPTEELTKDKLDHHNITRSILMNSPLLLIIVIDHGDKLPVPHHNDFRIIQNVMDALSPLGVSVYDTVICGGGNSISIRQTSAYAFR